MRASACLVWIMLTTRTSLRAELETSKWGIPERDISSLHAMGWGLGSCKNCRQTVAAVGVIWEMPKYREMLTFSEMDTSEISRNVYLSEIKAPAGCFLTKGSFSEHTPDELIHFCYDLKKWLFPIFVFLVTFYGIKSLFYRKPKWSVWSIWTYSTGWILKCVI